MNRIRVATAVLNQTPLDWDGNRANIVAAIRQAREQGARLLCLPELCISGYGCEDAFHGPDVQQMAWHVLEEILPETRGMIVCLGLPVLHRNALFSCACLVAEERIVGLVAKRYLSGDGLHYEPRWFKAWPQGVHERLSRGGREYPIGDLVFNCGGVKLGLEICEDAWVAARPGGGMSPHGIDLILNPSASHFAFGKYDVRQRLVLEGSRAFNVSYIYANLLGNEAGRVIYDGGALIASAGELIAAGPRFSFRPVDVTTADVDIAATRMRTAQRASYQPRLGEPSVNEVECPFDWPNLEPEPNRPTRAAWETGSHRKQEEFTRAVALGLFDYLRKSRSRGFVVSLSGGADSSAAACLVALMVDLAVGELGPDGLAERLPHIPGLGVAPPDGPHPGPLPEREGSENAHRVRRLLHCVYQGSENSSQTTRDAAAGVAGAIGAEFSEWRIDTLVSGYIERLQTVLGRELTWEQDDLALQNIQARVRGPGAWLLANVKRFLLLTTSNRSEAAVGYATMDGDTCGGLAPIAGIDKAFLREWLRWLETIGPDDLPPIPALAAVNRQQPTAELRPAADKQTDEEDLMPYPVLDWIERAAIRDKRGPMEVFRLMRVEFPDATLKQLHHWVGRFFSLWSRNQWKRERYAPSFHVDDENLDPKTWCRFPILSGGFERELSELSDYVERVKAQNE